MPIACKLCIATRGLRGSDISGLPQSEEDLAQHMEQEHHVPVRRNDESEAECTVRFAREQPGAGGPNCKCPMCSRTKKAFVRNGKYDHSTRIH